MDEATLNIEIAAVTKAITNMLKTGQIYETQNSSSKRKFQGFSLAELRAYRTDLYMQLENVTGTSGIIVGF